MKTLNIKKKIESNDKSVKYILELFDGEVIEAVFIKLENENKVCISSQVGCVNKCSHCATGKNIDYKRDLGHDEIVSQVLTMVEDRDETCENLTVMFMGMGEPFFNYKNVVKSLELFKNIGIKPDRVTVSTSGVIPKILEIAKLKERPKLAVSIHATTESSRDKIIPLNKVYGLNDLMNAIQEYTNLTNEKVLIQYTLIESINDSDQDAFRLARLVKGINCEVQIIPFNSFPTSSFNEPKPERIEYFMKYFQLNGIDIELKPSSGADIYAGCGQLGCFSK